jgi:hypothetical protein
MDVRELKPEGTAFSETFRVLRGSFWMKASMVGGRRAVPLLNYTSTFVLELRNSTETSVRLAEYCYGTLCVDLAAILGSASTGPLSTSPWLIVDDVRQPLVRTSAFQGAPAPGNFEPKLSISALTWLAYNRIPTSSRICLLLTHRDSSIAVRITFAASEHGCGQLTCRPGVHSKTQTGWFAHTAPHLFSLTGHSPIKEGLIKK